MKDGMDLGKRGPYADKISAFAQKIADMDRARGGIPAIPKDGIVSGPIEHSPSGSTMCSKTARENGERLFGMRLPRGNAIDVQNGYGPEGLRHSDDPTKSPIEISNGLPPSDPKANFADVFTGSKSEYGHRAVAFKDGDAWLVLDPYVTKTSHPVSLADYEKLRPIRKAALYSLPSASA